MATRGLGIAFALLLAGPAWADESHHDHPPPERLGTVTFSTTCAKAVRPAFDRAVALLHSFAYSAAERAFQAVAARDPHCAMAHWGAAMTHWHPLWPDPPTGKALEAGVAEIGRADQETRTSPRERQFIAALGRYYADAEHMPEPVRAQRYADAMAGVARRNPRDDEAQVFYALALIATASPSDRTHGNQKRAAAILEPIWRRQPQHPGVPHYLIHAYDSVELAAQGVPAARAYSKIAPAAPHALHMPSHIFTRLGLWDDSIASNLAARAAARAEGDLGEELHAMDYLVYADLQRGRAEDAKRIAAEIRSPSAAAAAEFKVGYAATAMPTRVAVELADWRAARALEPLPGSKPQVEAIVYWARALGHARGGAPAGADAEIARLEACVTELRAAGNAYWATQVDAMLKEARGWRAAAGGDADAAVANLRAAADEEDALEKLPVTPGPIVPAREQLAQLLLELKRPAEALAEFKAALALAPGRRGALLGAISAAEQIGDARTAADLRGKL